jgi:glucose-6-phosphate isomerase
MEIMNIISLEEVIETIKEFNLTIEKLQEENLLPISEEILENIPNIFEYTGLNYLGGKTINRLINPESDATAVALTDYKRPNIPIRLPKINEYYLAQLFYMLEMQTAIIGELYNIDAFNQPGVEQAKNYTYALMGRLGYEESAQELNEKINRNKEITGI